MTEITDETVKDLMSRAEILAHVKNDIVLKRLIEHKNDAKQMTFVYAILAHEIYKISDKRLRWIETNFTQRFFDMMNKEDLTFFERMMALEKNDGTRKNKIRNE